MDSFSIASTASSDRTQSLRGYAVLMTSVVVTGCDSIPIVMQALQAASTFRAMTQQQVATLLGRTARLAKKRPV
jgi:hypothetical protein